MMRILLSTLLMMYTMTGVAAEQTLHLNEDNGLYTWTSVGDGFSVELIQVVPDFIRAIYGKHAFPKAEIEDIATYCVYGSVIKNTSDKVLTYDVSNWRYEFEGKSHPVKTKTQWLRQWRDAGVVFSWTLLPDEGEFYEGDWQQGFTTIKLPRGSRFDLTYTWSLDGKKYSDRITGLECPPAEVTLP